MCRDALLHRAHEIQPAFYDSEKDKTRFFLFYFFHFLIFIFSRTSLFLEPELGFSDFFCQLRPFLGAVYTSVGRARNERVIPRPASANPNRILSIPSRPFG